MSLATGSSVSPQQSPRGTKRLHLPSLGLSCSAKRQRRATGISLPCPRRNLEKELAESGEAAEPLPFWVLADGPYFVIASWLDASDLSSIDATCQQLCHLNAEPGGPWRGIGSSAFFGMELDVPGGFFSFDSEHRYSRQPKPGRPNWKFRYNLFHSETPTFSAPFWGKEILEVQHPDEVAYCRCRLRTDVLVEQPERGVYVEMNVRANADNLSLALVDFDGGGRSSVTFSPETGAVLRERKVRESPRAIEGTYMHFLPSAPQGDRFEGIMGLYLQNGHIAFFRKWANGSAPTQDIALTRAGVQDANANEASWETTGFCTDLRWAFGPRLSLCLAFRDAGQYNVCITKMCHEPPIAVRRADVAYQDNQWRHLYGDDNHPLAI